MLQYTYFVFAFYENDVKYQFPINRTWMRGCYII